MNEKQELTLETVKNCTFTANYWSRKANDPSKNTISPNFRLTRALGIANFSESKIQQCLVWSFQIQKDYARSKKPLIKQRTKFSHSRGLHAFVHFVLDFRSQVLANRPSNVWLSNAILSSKQEFLERHPRLQLELVRTVVFKMLLNIPWPSSFEHILDRSFLVASYPWG